MKQNVGVLVSLGSKSIFYFIIITFSLFFFFLLSSCSDHDLNSNVIEKQSHLDFEVFFDTANFRKLNNDEKIKKIIFYLEKNTNEIFLDHTKAELIEELIFILNKEPEKSKKWIDEILLLNSNLFDNGWAEQSKRIASILVNNFNLKASGKVNCLNIIAYYFNFYNNIDSLEYIVSLLAEEATFGFESDKQADLFYFTNLANLCNLKGDFFGAAVNYRKALNQISSGTSYSYNRSTLFQNLATMYLNLDYIEKAKIYIDSSLVLIGNNALPLHMYNTIGTIGHRTGDFENSQKAFEKVIEISKKEKNLPLLAQSYANMANLKRKKEEFEEAIMLTILSDSICNKLGIRVGLLINQINRAYVYYDQNKFNLARNEMLFAKEKLDLLKIPKLNKDFYELFYKIEDALGNFEQANKYYRQYNENKNEYIGDLPRSVIAEWELSNEMAQKADEIANLTLSIEQKKSENYLIALISALSLFIVSMFLLFSIYKSQKTKKMAALDSMKLKHELELKTKEVLAKSMQNMLIENLKSELSLEIKTLILNLPKGQKQNFDQFLNRLKPKVTSKYIDEFEIRFKSVHESFYVRLKEICPNLTPNELRICAFMKLNITTKDMALITNRTTGTIENIRIGIRRKLNLDKNINLQQFIINL